MYKLNIRGCILWYFAPGMAFNVECTPVAVALYNNKIVNCYLVAGLAHSTSNLVIDDTGQQPTDSMYS